MPPLAKESARANIVAALNEGDWSGKTRVVRVNDLHHEVDLPRRDQLSWRAPGPTSTRSCCPRCSRRSRSSALDLLLCQIEKTMGLEVGRIGIEAQIENAAGLIAVDDIAAASPRVETIIFGPADFMASINMRTLVVGEQPPGYDVGDAYHYILMRILMAARAHDLQAIDGPYLQIKDVDGFRRVAGRSAALGFDGKWVLHPGQIDAANEVYSPAQDDYDHAELILDAYDYYTSEAGGHARSGHARRRDDRRGITEDVARRRGEGACRRAVPYLEVRGSRDLIVTDLPNPCDNSSPARRPVVRCRRSRIAGSG